MNSTPDGRIAEAEDSAGAGLAKLAAPGTVPSVYDIYKHDRVLEENSRTRSYAFLFVRHGNSVPEVSTGEAVWDTPAWRKTHYVNVPLSSLPLEKEIDTHHRECPVVRPDDECNLVEQIDTHRCVVMQVRTGDDYTLDFKPLLIVKKTKLIFPRVE